jgi:hypothetical protein
VFDDAALDHYWHTPDTISALLTDAGLHAHARTPAEPEGDGERQRAFLPARKQRHGVEIRDSEQTVPQAAARNVINVLRRYGLF